MKRKGNIRLQLNYRFYRISSLERPSINIDNTFFKNGKIIFKCRKRSKLFFVWICKTIIKKIVTETKTSIPFSIRRIFHHKDRPVIYLNKLVSYTRQHQTDLMLQLFQSYPILRFQSAFP